MKNALPIKVTNFYEAPTATLATSLAGAPRLAGAQHGGIVGLASGLHYAMGGLVPVDNKARYAQMVAEGGMATGRLFASGGLVPVALSRENVSCLPPISQAHMGVPSRRINNTLGLPVVALPCQALDQGIPSTRGCRRDHLSSIGTRRARWAIKGAGLPGGTVHRLPIAPPVRMTLTHSRACPFSTCAGHTLRVLRMRRRSFAYWKTGRDATVIPGCNRVSHVWITS